jgi:hypothetical protein
MPRLKQRLIEIADDILAYVCTVAGIVFSNSITLLKSNEPFIIDVSMWRLAASAFVAFMIIRNQEKLTPDKEGKTELARAGRRARFIPRMQNAAANGFMWSQIMSIGG